MVTMDAPELCLLLVLVSGTWAWDSPAVHWPGSSVNLTGEDVLVDTALGTVRGKRRPGHAAAGGLVRFVDYFLGIPYAEPPLGTLRFKPPVPVSPWQDIKNATRFGAVCPQTFEYKQMKSDEDCLTLNIFVPHKEGVHDPWPVLVYIHGGSYRVGTGASYLGGPLAQREVIVVTINYRLGILGFISSRTEELPGNNGILDQIESLQWVNKHIASFGGDPSRVTIFGNSAGGASVGILMVSPLAKGLFQQSIVQSGSPLSFWALHNDTVDLVQHTRQVAKVFKCSQDNFSQVVECLRGVPAEYLGDCSHSDIPSISVSTTNFRPHTDSHVIPSDLVDLYRSGAINPSVVMAGIVDREWSRHFGTMIMELRMKSYFDSHFSDGLNRPSFKLAIQDIFERQFGWGETVSRVVTHEYTNWSNVNDPVANREQYITFMTDFGMIAPTVNLLNKLAEREVPAFAYRFNHRSSEDKPVWSSNAHLMELHYVFGAPFLEYDIVFGTQKNFSEEDKEMSLYMMQLWSDFAKYGDPSRSSERTVEWTAYSANTSDYLAISSTIKEMAENLGSKAAYFWNDLIPSISWSPGHAEGKLETSGLGPVSMSLLVLTVLLAIVVLVLLVLLHRARTRSHAKNVPVEI